MDNTSDISLLAKQIKIAISSGQRFLLLPHSHMDGDALGSMLALGLALEQMGKEAYLYTHEHVPERYKFLEGSEKVTDVPPTGKFDAVFIVECPDYKRLPKIVTPKQLTDTIITLDHHNDPQDGRFVGNINGVDPSMSAVGEMIALLLFEMGVPLTSSIATALYTAIVSDSKSFRLPSVTPRTHMIAASLLGTGLVDNEKCAYQAQIYRSPQERGVTDLCLATRRSIVSGRVGYALLSSEMLEQYNTNEGEIQNLIDDLNIGYEAFALFKAVTPGIVRVSLRSQKVSVVDIANSFGGGGHDCACAMTFGGEKGYKLEKASADESDLEAAQRLVLAKLEEKFQ